jgi:hypothetical protein
MAGRRAGRGFLLRPTRPIVRRAAAVLAVGFTTTGLAAVDIGSSSASSLVASTTGSAPISVGTSSAPSLVSAATTTTGATPISVGSSNTATLIVTTTGAAPVNVGSSASSTLIATTSGATPIGVSSSGAASIVGAATTGAAPVSIGSSSASSLVSTTNGTAPVSIATSSRISFSSSSPISIGSSSAVSSTITLAGWVADLSQRTSLDLDCPDGVLVVDPPLAVAPDGTGGPGPGGTGGPLVTERMLRRASHLMPIPTPDADGHYRQSTPWDVIEGDVGVLHTVVGGVDRTYFMGIPTEVDSWSAAEPFGDANAQVSFPQLTTFDTTGVGDWAWLVPGASLDIFILDADGVTRHPRFAGHFISDEGGNGADTVNTVWQAEGTLFQADHTGIDVPTILPPTDIGTLIAKSLNGVVSRRYGTVAKVTTTIPSRKRGSLGDTPIGYVQDLLATATDTTGKQWTVTKTPNTPRQYQLRKKNTTTVHWQITAGAVGVETALSRDLLSTVNCIMGRGIAPDGYAWAGTVYPNFLPDDAPPFPFTSPAGVITLGMSDAGTDSGTGVSTWQRRANELGHHLVVDGVYNSNDQVVCRAIQKAYGILVDGVIGGQTWTATFEVGSGGGDLTGTYRRPLAIDPAVEKFLYAASGAITGPNPAYNPKILRLEREEDFGAGVTKAEATISAKAELARDRTAGLYGTITLLTDPHEGSRWLINEGDNIRVLGYRGGNPLLHIVEISANPASHTVTLTVDEHARDAMTLASIAADRRDAAPDPARRPGGIRKRSGMDQDQVTPFDGDSEAGVIPRHAIRGGLWSVIRIPVSQVGRIAKADIRTESPAAKFCIAFLSGPTTSAHLQHLVGDPLAGADAWNKTEAQATALDNLGLLEAFGRFDDPAGYWPGHMGTHALTGRLLEKGGWDYGSDHGVWVWVAEWSPVSTFVEGRLYPAPIQ